MYSLNPASLFVTVGEARYLMEEREQMSRMFVPIFNIHYGSVRRRKKTVISATDVYKMQFWAACFFYTRRGKNSASIFSSSVIFNLYLKFACPRGAQVCPPFWDLLSPQNPHPAHGAPKGFIFEDVAIAFSYALAHFPPPRLLP